MTNTNKGKNSPARSKAIDLSLNNEEEGCSLVNQCHVLSMKDDTVRSLKNEAYRKNI